MESVFTAQPSRAWVCTARLTAFQVRLLKMTKSAGKLYARDTKWAAVGAPKMYAPSPTQQMTVLSGAASLAPSAAPRPQPSPPDDGAAK